MSARHQAAAVWTQRDEWLIASQPRRRLDGRELPAVGGGIHQEAILPTLAERDAECESRPVTAECDAADPAALTAPRGQEPATVGIPEPEHAVCLHRDDAATVAAERRPCHAIPRSDQESLLLARSHVHDPQPTLGHEACHATAIRTDRHRSDRGLDRRSMSKGLIDTGQAGVSPLPRDGSELRVVEVIDPRGEEQGRDRHGVPREVRRPEECLHSRVFRLGRRRRHRVHDRHQESRVAGILDARDRPGLQIEHDHGVVEIRFDAVHLEGKSAPRDRDVVGEKLPRHPQVLGGKA